MTASKGLRPAWLFLSSAASLTTASISARKLSKGTRALSASSGSPLALIALRRLSRSKKPGCPTAFPCAAAVGTPESDLRRARQCFFSRCPDEGAYVLCYPQGRNAPSGLTRIGPGLAARRRRGVGDGEGIILPLSIAIRDALPAEDHTEDPGLRRVSDVGR